MNKFKVGDKVKVRDDLRVGRYYGELDFLIEMENLKGKELTIDSISIGGNYAFKESDYYYSEEMLEEFIDDNYELFEFALDKLNTTKEELRKEYKKNKTEKQVVENMKKCCDDFANYCNSKSCCTCDVYKFKERNNLGGLGDRNCIMIYEHLFKKEGE